MLGWLKMFRFFVECSKFIGKGKDKKYCFPSTLSNSSYNSFGFIYPEKIYLQFSISKNEQLASRKSVFLSLKVNPKKTEIENYTSKFDMWWSWESKLWKRGFENRCIQNKPRRFS